MNSVVGIRLFFWFSFWVLVPYALFVVYQREVDIFFCGVYCVNWGVNIRLWWWNNRSPDL